MTRFLVDALREGRDVYLFLLGMIALAELAGTQGAYSWLADRLVRLGASSAARAFWLVYGAGIVVTTFLSNDATILLLTPAAFAISRRCGVSAVPAAFAVAFVANAASFVLPISNPSNLLLYPHLPATTAWLRTFAAPSAAAVGATAAVLFFCFRYQLKKTAATVEMPRIARTRSLSVTLLMVLASCIVLLAAATFQLNVGITAFACAACSIAVVSAFDRSAIPSVLRDGQWSIVVLVAVLFVLVRVADHYGAVGVARDVVTHAALLPPPLAQIATGFAVAAFANLINNLPAAVVAHFAAPNNAAALIGINLGPNAALSGSLATILWARIVRKNGESVGIAAFMRIGLTVTIPSLALALAVVR